MLKFFKHNLETITGIATIISLLIFFLFFICLYTWTYTYKKDKIQEMSNLPFSDSDEDTNLFI